MVTKFGGAAPHAMIHSWPQVATVEGTVSGSEPLVQVLVTQLGGGGSILSVSFAHSAFGAASS